MNGSRPTAEAIRRASVRSTQASFLLEGRNLPDDYEPPIRVQRLLEKLWRTKKL